MASRRPPKTRTHSEMTPQSTGAATGYEAELWAMADTLRGSMDAAIAENLKALGFGNRRHLW